MSAPLLRPPSSSSSLLSLLTATLAEPRTLCPSRGGRAEEPAEGALLSSCLGLALDLLLLLLAGKALPLAPLRPWRSPRLSSLLELRLGEEECRRRDLSL